MLEKSYALSTAKAESFPATLEPKPQQKLSDLLPAFLRYGQFELSFSPNTVAKYHESLKMVIRHIGDLPVQEIRLTHLTLLKQKVLMGGASDARVASLVFPLKSLLRFCKQALGLDVIDHTKVKGPKRVRREVLFLSNEEIAQFVDSIKIYNTWERKTKKECLRLDGKPYLFVNQRGSRMEKCDVQYIFKRHTKAIGLNKKITPHILRHTMATNLLFNGCPISHVKEILGHDRLETTCCYYLGLDKSKAKEAHGKFLNY